LGFFFAGLLLGNLLIGLLLYCYYIRSVTRRKQLSQLDSEIRAERLLREILGAEQFHSLDTWGYLEIMSPSRPNRIYLVPYGRELVHVLEDGKVVMTLCVQPAEWLPVGDVVLMHKLMIEANEEDYLKIANQIKPGYPYDIR
jgi:hypothetical protein